MTEKYQHEGDQVLVLTHYHFALQNKINLNLKYIFAICDPTPANEALCGKINFELYAKM